MAKVDGYQVGISEGDTLEMAPRPLTIVLGPATWGAGLLSGIKGATGLPPWGNRSRDLILRQSVHLDGMWASAVNMAITKHVALGYNVADSEDAGRRLSAAQALLKSYDTHAMAQGLRDYLTTNAGQFIGLERASGSRGGRITRLLHLDSLRCYPTNNPDYPVLYQTPIGGYRLLPDSDVIHLVDMASREAYRQGVIPVGLCAADRAWDTILKLTAMETYFREKVSGTRNLAIHIVRGLSYQQLNDALASTAEEQDRRGFVVYRGSTIIPVMSDTEVQLTTIPLAEIPDGFEVDTERRDAYLRIANAIGLPVQDLQPLSGQGLGTGTQTLILSEDAEGRGLASWRQSFAEQINDRALPPQVTFTWTNTNDVRDQKMKAEADKLAADALAVMVTAGAITPAQMANALADAEIIPRAFLQADATPGGTLSEDEKPLTDAPLLPTAPPALPAPQALKARDDMADRLVRAALNDDRAWAWAKAALEGDEGDA
jgi:hypothetical protein